MSDKQCSPDGYSAFATALENMPYAMMLPLGAAIITVGLSFSSLALAMAIAYVIYGILGSLSIILFVCPYCPIYGKRSCPCGYGVLAARLRPAGDTALFPKKFKLHIATIVPLWIIPLVFGIALSPRSPSWTLSLLIGAFILDAFVILPLLSKEHGCKNCEQREVCPWMNQ